MSWAWLACKSRTPSATPRDAAHRAAPPRLATPRIAIACQFNDQELVPTTDSPTR